jgi:hypothetical protein
MAMFPTLVGSKTGTGQPHDFDSMSLAQLPARLQLHRSKTLVNRNKAVVKSQY